MTVNNVIPKIWSARLKQNFEKATIFGGLMTDVSSELSDGNSLELGSITSTPTIRNYARNTALANPEIMDDSAQTLTLDKLKYFNIAVDDVDAVQARPAIVDAYTNKASVELAKQHDADLLTAILATKKASNNTAVAAITDTESDEDLQTLITRFLTVNKQFSDMNIPPSDRWGVISTSVAHAVQNFMLSKGVGTGTVADGVFNSGQIGSFLGMSIAVSTDLAGSFAASSNAVLAAFGIRQSFVTATQIRKVEGYRPPNLFADAVKGLMVYGTIPYQLDTTFFWDVT